MPELNTRQNQYLYRKIRAAKLDDSLGSIIMVRWWSYQEDLPRKQRALEDLFRSTLSIHARKEIMYHLSQYFKRRGNSERASELLEELRSTQGGSLALDPENYWVGMANLELGREAFQGQRYIDAKVYFTSITTQAQVRQETLAEAYYWLASIAHFEGNTSEEQQYRRSLQEIAPNSEWIQLLDSGP